MAECCVVMDFVPNPSFGGFSITMYGVVKGLLNAGLKPHICCIISDAFGSDVRKMATHLEELGAKAHLVYVHTKPKNIFDKLVPYSLMADEVKKLIQEISPRAILAGSYEGLFALTEIDPIPIFALLGDPYHLVRWYSWRYNLPNKSFVRNMRSAVISIAYSVIVNKRIKKMFKKTALRGAIAPQHARWYSRFAGRECIHYRGPVEDVIGNAWRAERKKQKTLGKKYKLIHVGNTGGTTNRPGIQDFVRVILPYLDTHLGRGMFEIHFLGHTLNPEPSLKKVCKERDDVILRGQVDPINNELLSADLMFVPNPIRMGNRTRIVTAWSFGCPVVTHIANTVGIPEIQHKKNALVSCNAREMGKHIIELLSDVELQNNLAENGRKTFEELFELNVAATRIGKDFLKLMQSK
ncbi:glycosyltransferase [Candidatus Omnitrophota bacterium]